jgi:hypothetical protein
MSAQTTLLGKTPYVVAERAIADAKGLLAESAEQLARLRASAEG